MAIEKRHVQNAARARNIYLASLNPAEASEDWQFAKRLARRQVASALRASGYLSDIVGALMQSGEHTIVFRQMLAPPLSQDQFKLVCSAWSKAAENNGTKISRSAAEEIAIAILERLDRGLVRWEPKTSRPNRREIEAPLVITSTQIALQKVATARRTRLASEQEIAIVNLLEAAGWQRLPSRLIDERAQVPEKSFMRKTRFATGSGSKAHQEVDIACGLKGSYVLAMECKVTNDETNSVKRVNDVLKKAAAWKRHWGSFVVTAALLQGVVGAKDVQRLSDNEILVFWSHDLNEFHAWLAQQIN